MYALYFHIYVLLDDLFLNYILFYNLMNNFDKCSYHHINEYFYNYNFLHVHIQVYIFLYILLNFYKNKFFGKDENENIYVFLYVLLFYFHNYVNNFQSLDIFLNLYNYHTFHDIYDQIHIRAYLSDLTI